MTAPSTPAPTGPSPADSTPPPAPLPAAAPRLRLVLVRTPGPPLEDRPAQRLLVPGRRSPRPVLVPGPRPRVDGPQGNDELDFGPEASRRRDLSDPALAGRRVVTMTLEAFAGRRPMSQLQSVFTLPVFTAVSRGRRPRWCVEGTGPLLVSSVHVGEPVDGVAEVSAVARRNGRAHAVAARLEGMDGQWRCTALQVG